MRVWSRQVKSWAQGFPVICEALRALRTASVVLDGEAVAHCMNGLPYFYGLRGEGAETACLYVFDLLMINGHDLRMLAFGSQ